MCPLAIMVVAALAAVGCGEDSRRGLGPGGRRLFLRAADLRRRSVRRTFRTYASGFNPHELRELLHLLGTGPAPRCGTCAVVGAAGSLARGEAGAEINGHDCVFRVNLAVVKNFDLRVGRKHTVHVWSMPTGVGTLVERKQQHLLAKFAHAAENISVFFPYTGDAVRVSIKLGLEGKLPLPRLRIMHPELVEELCRHDLMCDSIKRPSTGLLAAHLAMQMCASRPKLFGFDVHSIPFHYYDPPDTVCDAEVGGRRHSLQSVHMWSSEQMLLRRWGDAGLVELDIKRFTPPPNISHCVTPRVLEVDEAYPELGGEFVLQKYTVNGKIVYAKRDQTFVLFFSLCKTEGGSGLWMCSPWGILEESQRRTPGVDNSCIGSAYSKDFRPERPSAGHWHIVWASGEVTPAAAGFLRVGRRG